MINLPYLLALHSIDGLGPIRLKKIIDYFKDPKLAWSADLSEFRNLGIPANVIAKITETRKNFDVFQYIKNIEDSGIKVLTIFDENYPKRLKQIYDPPIVIYYKGEILESDFAAIGIVGTRKITGYGRTVTEKFASDLSQKGLTIVSGLARGVDTVAHKTAVSVGGRTIAVLGGGLNKIFPLENSQLARDIANGHGAVISEFPPDYPSVAGNFPARNRIIAGLSMAVLVTEAAEDSGSLITARIALEEGREVFAIPGPVTSTLSKGPADLIKDGARLAFYPEDIIQDLELNIHTLPAKIALSQKLTDGETEVLNCLENESKHVDFICRELKKSTAEISALLIKMEILGLVKNLGGGNFIKAL